MKKLAMALWSVILFCVLFAVEKKLLFDSVIPLEIPYITTVIFLIVLLFQLRSPEPKISRATILILYILPIGLTLVIYWQKNTYAGGDVDPIAFLQNKTSARGGYFLLTDKTTYRQRVISKEDFFAHPFSPFKLLRGVPSIAIPKDYPIAADIPTHGRTMHVTMSLRNAVVHLPFNKTNLRALFAEQIRTEGYNITSTEHMIASELQSLATPVFRSMKKYPPAEGYFEIEIDDPTKALGELAQYGFKIVSLPGDKPRLQFQITYGEGQESYFLIETKQTSLQPND